MHVILFAVVFLSSVVLSVGVGISPDFGEGHELARDIGWAFFISCSYCEFYPDKLLMQCYICIVKKKNDIKFK